MDADGLPLVGPGLDYTKIEAINQKRITAFINHLISHTVQFLNHFAVICEEKLCDIDVRLQRLEATTSIVESKLSYIPGLDEVTVPKSAAPIVSNTEPVQNNQHAQSSPPPLPSSQEAQANGTAEVPDMIPPKEPTSENTVNKDPRYIKFFKMLSIGIAPGAVKQKMTIEGLNADLLDTPNAPAPPPDIEDTQSSDNETSSMSDSDDDS